MKRMILLTCGCVAFGLGFIGIFVPVLPTTPFMLLATFLFAKSSPRLHAWIQSTKAYRHYVIPFQNAGGINVATKARILFVSYLLMGISAYFVQRWYVWLLLAAVAIFLLYLMVVRIPTITKEEMLIQRQKYELENNA